MLLTEPYTAPDSFYGKVLHLPAFTGKALEVFRARKTGKNLLDTLRKIAGKPRSLLQYSQIIAAQREFSGKAQNVPEYDSANHIMILVMRHGDTRDAAKFITFENTDFISEHDMEVRERKRIQPFVDQLLKSQDKEAALVAALSLAAYTADPKTVSAEYTARIRKIGMELLQKMPSGLVRETLQLLSRSITDTRDRAALSRIISEMRLIL